VPSNSASPPGAPASTSAARVFRLPVLTYLVVLFFAMGAVPAAFTGIATSGTEPVYGPQLLFLLVPILAGLFIWRTATVVSDAGITVRAIVGRRVMPWDALRGLRVAQRSVYAVLPDGSVRLPCVHVTDLAEVSRLSGGRLPDIPEAQRKYAPAKPRRGRRTR
jgi:Bacterial PH domain